MLAATEHLQQKLTKLESRMRALEDALAVTHGTCSDEPHPLLIRRHDFVDDDRAKSPSDESARSSPGLSEHVQGNLVVDSQGNTSFFGPTGASEVRVFVLFRPIRDRRWLLTHMVLPSQSLLMVSVAPDS